MAQSASSHATHSTLDPHQSIRHFVLDTNVLLHNPDALFVFQDNNVIIPFQVIEELDKMKRRDDDIGRAARQVIRHLDRLRTMGSLTQGVRWGDAPIRVDSHFRKGPKDVTGTIRIDIDPHERPPVLYEDQPDNRIIAVALDLMKHNNSVVFVSKDISARIKSDSLGVPTEDFENQKVDVGQLYSGWLQISAEGSLIDDLYEDKMLSLDRLEPMLKTSAADGSEYLRTIEPNEYVVLNDTLDESHTGLARRAGDTEHIVPVTGPRKPISGIIARNLHQTMAMDMLLDDQIRFVTLLGPAGTGKTLLALAAGMTKTFGEERYDKLLCARPIMPMGHDIGYLPGDKDEKLAAWMQPIFDNLSYLLSTRGSPHQQAESHSPEQRIEKLIADGRLVLEPLTYIRGRSIPHQFMLVDEAQNLTPHEVKTIASRVGEGTKLVLTGDIEQIDNPYLDQSSNGLSYAVEKMKGLSIVGHVTLEKSERSELASLAAERL